MKASKVKTYKGNAPTGPEWELCHQFQIDEEKWEMYVKAQEHSYQWVTYKICAVGKVPRKANYWAAHNAFTGQIGFTRDITLMRANRPKLHEQVMSFLEKND